MSPSDGERRLISAIAPRPGPARASLNRMAEPRELVEPGGGGAGIDGRARQLEPFAEVVGVAGRRDRTGRVEQDRVPAPPVGAGEHLADRLRVVGGRAAAQLVRVAALDAE